MQAPTGKQSLFPPTPPGSQRFDPVMGNNTSGISRGNALKDLRHMPALYFFLFFIVRLGVPAKPASAL